MSSTPLDESTNSNKRVTPSELSAGTRSLRRRVVDDTDPPRNDSTIPVTGRSNEDIETVSAQNSAQNLAVSHNDMATRVNELECLIAELRKAPSVSVNTNQNDIPKLKDLTNRSVLTFEREFDSYKRKGGKSHPKLSLNPSQTRDFQFYWETLGINESIRSFHETTEVEFFCGLKSIVKKFSGDERVAHFAKFDNILLTEKQPCDTRVPDYISKYNHQLELIRQSGDETIDESVIVKSFLEGIKIPALNRLFKQKSFHSYCEVVGELIRYNRMLREANIIGREGSEPSDKPDRKSVV